MDQFRFVHITQNGFDFLTGMAQDLLRFLRAVINQTAGNFTALPIQAGHYFATFEIAGNRSHADRQQAFSFLAQCIDRAIVKRKFAADLEVVGEPLLARRRFHLSGDELGADRFALRQADQRVRLAPSGDDSVGAAAGRALGG